MSLLFTYPGLVCGHIRLTFQFCVGAGVLTVLMIVRDGTLVTVGDQ